MVKAAFGASCALALVIGIGGCATKPPAVPPVGLFADAYFDSMFAWNPSYGTSVGLHQYDKQMEVRSAEAFQKRIETVKSQLQAAESLAAAKPAGDDAIDLELIHNALRSELLELQTVQGWRRNPMEYVGAAGGAVDLLMKRDFAPAKERLAAATARLAATPALIAAMKANVTNPPKEFTDLAIRVAAGSVGFLEKDVAAWAKQAAGGDAVALAEFAQANGAAVAAMKDAAAWLRADLLPRSKGAYAIGAENFSKKLLYEEMMDLPLERVLAVGQANLEKDYQAFVETAKKIDPKRTPAEVMKTLELEHPTEADLLPAARRTIEGTRAFLIEKKIVTVPSEVRPRIEETPPYARTGGFASMDTPGPFEAKASEAFYYVTPPEKEWDARHKEEHLRLYNKSVMQIITIHEAFPGHYLQFLYGKQFPTKTRKLVGAASNIEGWAHYTEQMLLEQGYGNGDPKIRLAQLAEALLRDCRYITGIMLHTQGWTVEQGQKLFVEKGFQQPANAYEEARRGAYNPTYLYYTLGKLMIYKLRGDYEKAKGAGYSLQGFHDEFVKNGAMPLTLMRRVMLPGDTAPLL